MSVEITHDEKTGETIFTVTWAQRACPYPIGTRFTVAPGTRFKTFDASGMTGTVRRHLEGCESAGITLDGQTYLRWLSPAEIVPLSDAQK